MTTAIAQRRRGLGDPHQGDQSPDFPGCYWTDWFQTYVCDDGYTIDGEPWLADEVTKPPVSNTSGDNRYLESVRPLAAVKMADVDKIIAANGYYETVPNDGLVAAARASWWRYSIEPIPGSPNVRIVFAPWGRWLMYGGAGVAGVVIVRAIASRK